jgi:tetratricopeptide (TPR) repeat protein
MAPEQHRGQPADARTDQFAFCVALYEGLYGERPFAGRTAGEIGENVLEGRIREPSTHRRVPGWVRRAVLKGLAVDPAERYPSTHALLSALERDSRRTWRRWLTALLVLGAAVAGGLGYQHFAEEPFRLCRGAERKLVGVWDEARKRALEAAFLRTGKPYAAQASSTVERLLDDYAQGWLAMHVQACEATRVHGEQSELLLDLRVQCLQDRLNEVRGLTDLFVQADARVVERATKAAHGLTRLHGCAGPELLTSGVRPPEDPSQRAQVEELRARLADAKALRETGHYREALRRAQRLAAYAREVPYRPVQAEALYLLGRLQDDAGDKAAEGTLLEAVRAAEAGRHDRVAALAWIELVFVAGRHMRFREAHERGAHAGAAIERLGGDEDLRAGLLLNLGAALRKEGRAEEALANHREALRVFEKLRGPNHPLVATTLGNLGVALVQMDRPTEAVPVLERSLAIRERVLGPEHPEVGLSLGGLGSAFFSLGRLAEAVSAHRRSLSIYEKALGPNHLKVATVLGNLGTALRQTGHLEEALALWRRALAIREGALGPKHPSVGEALASLGHVYASQGRHAEAWIHYRKAAPILEQPGSIHLPNRVFLLYAMGVLHRQEGRYPEALTLLRQALALWEKAGRPRRAANALVEIAEVRRERGQLSASLELYERARAIWEKYPWYPDRAKCLTRIGEARLLQGRPGQALPALEEALRLRAGRETQPAEMAETSFALSRALRAEGRDLVRALRLARQAETVLSQAGTKHRGELAAVRTWIRQVERDQPRQ